MATNTLDKIRRRAVQIRKAHPGKKYQTALKEAGREYRETHKPKGKKKPAKKKAAKRVRVGKVSYSGGSVSVGAVHTHSDHKRALVRSLTEQLGWAMVAHSSAKTKTEKKKLAKRVGELKKKLRAAESL